jgi:hypothetical protein
MLALKQLLLLDKPTTKAQLYSEWPSPPEVILEDDEAMQFYNNIR